MDIVEKLLSINDYSRPGRRLKEARALILHWVGVENQRAASVWNYFEDNHPPNGHYSSAHYCIDLDGTVYHFVPDNEVAYHCGTSAPINAQSKQIYTDWARSVFGVYAEDPQGNSPNNASIGIELCVVDNHGNFDSRTLQSAVELTAHLCETHKIPLERVGTHNMVVGWKDCPRLWTEHPENFVAFKNAVQALLS
jgi:N-acetylmuramoyl-L-alanine amidase